MNIVFIGFASTFTLGMTYQDNQLCQQVLADGHQVTYLSNPEKFVDGVVVDTGAEDMILPDGLHLIRLSYCKVGPIFLTKKVRSFKGVYRLLVELQPDVIFCHNTQYWSILDVIRYKKNHPEVKFYADIHTAENNSGRNWVSMHLLHRVFYRWLTQRALPYLEKIFYISEECKDFALAHYGVPESMLEFYPLGGVLPTAEEYAQKRLRRRAELEMAENELLLIHSGKLDVLKRTAELLRAFAAVPQLKAKLVIIGAIPEETREELEGLIEADARVHFLGWKSADELMEYLCACDLYCQPGSQSATMQNAVCCSCPVMLYPHSSHTAAYDYGNVLWVKTEEDMQETFRRMEQGNISLEALRAGSQRCAKELLDYRTLAARLYR